MNSCGVTIQMKPLQQDFYTEFCLFFLCPLRKRVNNNNNNNNSNNDNANDSN